MLISFKKYLLSVRSIKVDEFICYKKQKAILIPKENAKVLVNHMISQLMTSKFKINNCIALRNISDPGLRLHSAAVSTPAAAVAYFSETP